MHSLWECWCFKLNVSGYMKGINEAQAGSPGGQRGERGVWRGKAQMSERHNKKEQGRREGGLMGCGGPSEPARLPTVL